MAPARDTDEYFLGIEGGTIRLRDGEVSLDSGELWVVPRGVEHCPYAEAETQILLIEPRVVNTGDSGGELTAGADLDQEVAQAEAKDVRMCLERP